MSNADVVSCICNGSIPGHAVLPLDGDARPSCLVDATPPERPTLGLGQALYEALVPKVSRLDWVRVLSSAGRERYERAAEVLFRRGYEQGRADQKKAAPPAKARYLSGQLVAERAAWALKWNALVTASRNFMAAQSADNVAVRTRARDELLTALREPL